MTASPTDRDSNPLTPSGPTQPGGDHPDQPALDRIAGALDETLFVTAGAGSGKTRTLVTRLRNLVTEAGVPLRSIAAITFTEKAATELRERVRAELQRVASAGDETPHSSASVRARAALEELDSAAIGTLHSFAHRILSEHPIEAGLPPRVEVLDEVASAVAFEERWAAFLDTLLEDGRLARPILLLTAAGVKPDALKEIAVSFNQNWDLVETRPAVDPPDFGVWQPRLETILARVDEVTEQRCHCNDESDPLCRLLDAYAHWAEQVRLASDESARLGLLRGGAGGRPRNSANGKGAKGRWEDGFDLNGLRSELHDIGERCDDLANEIAHTALAHVAVDLRRFTLEAAAERRREGRLEFHDLLVMARQLLRDRSRGPEARQALHRRYRRLLIDEFQDTDPIQIELAVLIASGDPHLADEAWQDVTTEPGHLFFVGDPKQSIYRFRRADIGVFLKAAEGFGAEGQVTLRANHRSGASLVDWLNTTFGELMTQPTYEPSIARRGDAPAGPAVAVVGRDVHDDRPRADELRAREARDVAATIGRALAEGWRVDRSADWTEPDWQPANAGDIAILVPTRLSLPFLEDALTDAGIPYRAESASLVYGSRLIRDLFATLRALDDPSDHLTTVTALRSPLFGCGDDDLFTFRVQHRGHFDYGLDQPDTVPPDHPVARGLSYLRGLRAERHWATPSELADRVVRDRRLLELATVGPRGRARDLWHQIRFVIDQARAWTDTTGGSLRQYLEWVGQQSRPGARVSEALLPETDDDAVRIMTVHAAKGLEFPITVVAGLSTQPRSRRAGGQAMWPPDGGPCILTVGRRVTSPAFESWKPLDEQMAHDERIRLLYVACSRARDHLVVSLHRSRRTKPPEDDSRLTSAEVLVEALGDTLDDLPDGSPAVAPEGPTASPTALAPEEAKAAEETKATGVAGVIGAAEGPHFSLSFEDWERERSGALRRSRRPRTVAATTLNHEGQPDLATDPGLQKRARDLDLPPWRKGRYGTAIGRAVHGVLQVIDLRTGEGLDEAVAAQALAEGVTGQVNEDRIRQLVGSALRAPCIVEARARPHWKEVHVAVPLPDTRTLEGYVDLLYRRQDGHLVVVDYKTGPDSLDADVTSLVADYRLQGASYALAVSQATGEDIAEMVFVFLTPEGPLERRLPDLHEAISEVHKRLSEIDTSVG